MIWLLTCEHYSNGLPLRYAEHFVKAIEVLESPRGYDVRVAPLYIRLEPLFDEARYFRYSRLLIDPERSIQDKQLFSPFTSQLTIAEKADITSRYYHPYRTGIQKFIEQYIDQGVFHIALHSFHPFQGNRNRESSIGIVFNSSDTSARSLAVLLRRTIKEHDPALKIRFNYPYRGNRVSFLDYLRNSFPENYIGLQLNVRNDDILDLRKTIYESLASLRGILKED